MPERRLETVLTYSFENTDSESMYEHLYRCIKQDILQKKLKSGEKLPSKRTFAKNLGVSTITVESAYAQLLAEGYIASRPGSGYTVSPLGAVPPLHPSGSAGPAAVPAVSRGRCCGS